MHVLGDIESNVLYTNLKFSQEWCDVFYVTSCVSWYSVKTSETVEQFHPYYMYLYNFVRRVVTKLYTGVFMRLAKVDGLAPKSALCYIHCMST